MASGRSFDLSMFDPFVAKYFSETHTMTAELLRQIETERMYERYFAGKKGLTFLDLGANIGLVSIYAADACRRIVAVEPDPDAFTVLKAITHGLPQIEPMCAAIAPANGPCDFHVNKINSTANSTVNTAGQLTRVRGVTLSSLLMEQQLTEVDFCKADIEGAEGESLSLGELVFAKEIIRSWYVETHNCPKTTWQHKLGELASNFLKLGYRHLEINGMGIYAKRR